MGPSSATIAIKPNCFAYFISLPFRLFVGAEERIILIDVGAVADGGFYVRAADEGEAADAVVVEVLGGEPLDARAVLEGHARDEDFEFDPRARRHRARGRWLPLS